MRITCPECQFSRDMADDKIPAGSIKATCPQCGSKFQFRAPAAGDGAEAVVERAQVLDGGASETQPAAEQTDDGPVFAPGEGAGPAQGKPSEIWQRLDDLGRSKPQREPERGSYSFSDAHEPRPTVDVPFEDPDNFGFFDGIWETAKRSMLHPGLFFGAIPLGVGVKRAVIFNILLGELGFLATTIWGEMGLDPIATMMNESGAGAEAAMTDFTFGGLMMTMIMLPAFMLAALYVGAGLMHLGLIMVKAADSGFEATLKVSCYAGSAALIQLIPFVGPVLGPLWQLVIFFIGLKSIHQTSYGRIVLGWLALTLAFAVAIFIITFVMTMMDPSATM